MTARADIAHPPPEAALTFLAPGSPRPSVYTFEPPPGVPPRRGEYLQVIVPIRDLRALAPAPSLDAHGFALVRHDSAAGPGSDPEAVAIRRREAVELVRRATGATKVLAFDHNVRSSAVVGRAEGGVREPAQRVHGDFTVSSGPARARAELAAAGEDADALLGRRFALVNVWRPLGAPVRRAHLALCDARTVGPDELVVADIVHPDRVGEIYVLAHGPRQRWFYASAMRPDEALLIKCFDSDPGRARFTPHGAFDEPGTPEGAPPRESIEVRTVAVFDA